MMINPGDVVIDAGAWAGDFSALASYYGATSYAFEPTPATFETLKKTADFNKNIIPVNMGLGSSKEELYITENKGNSGGNKISEKGTAKIIVTTLDDFVKENNIQKIDFIKADIEGFEREMLKGATWVLQNFEPKLSLCTYHLPDDPEVMKSLILKANPKYKIMQRKKKLYAWV